MPSRPLPRGFRDIGVVALLCDGCLSQAAHPFRGFITSVTMPCAACGRLVPAGPIGGDWAAFSRSEREHVAEPKPFRLMYVYEERC